MNTWPKICGCGHAISAEEWPTLEFCGRMTDEVECLELRTCACGSTIAIVVARDVDSEAA